MKRGRPPKRPVSTCWDCKTTDKRPRAKTKPAKSIHKEIEAGFRFFWSRRRVGQYHNGGSV